MSTIFLYMGLLQEDIFMTQQLDFVDPQYLNQVSKHQESLYVYGLKQTPRA